MSFKLVKAAESDTEYLLNLRVSTMTQHLEESGLFLTHDEHLQRLNYKYKCSYLVFHQGNRVGHIKFEVNKGSLELFQIQVEPELQGSGYGAGIIEKVISLAENSTVELSVLKTNSAA